jgi:hypothetical protein
METKKMLTKRFPPQTLVILLFFLISLFLICLSFLNQDFTKELVKEDGVIENSQALLFMAGAIFMFFSLFIVLKLNSTKKRKAIFYILFFGLFLFFFFEEISWGQRIFGFSTPESLSEINMQNETTIHNIVISDSLLWIQLIMGLFMVVIGLVLPILKLGSKRAAQMFKKFQFPVVHQDLIACFTMSLLFYSLSGFHWFIPLAFILLFIPPVVIISGRFRKFFNNFKYPLLQFGLVAIIGILVIAVNVNVESAQYFENNVAFEFRELLIAMSLFFFAAFETHDVWKRNRNSSGKNTQMQPIENPN